MSGQVHITPPVLGISHDAGAGLEETLVIDVDSLNVENGVLIVEDILKLVILQAIGVNVEQAGAVVLIAERIPESHNTSSFL